MTIGGWIFLLVSLAFVWGLTIWCFKKVLGGSKIEPPPDSPGDEEQVENRLEKEREDAATGADRPSR